MGLDQFAYIEMCSSEKMYNLIETLGAINMKIMDQQEDITLINNSLTNQQEMMYWRKHPNLQGWMERLYIRKMKEQGTPVDKDFEFNCVDLYLTLEDLDALEKDVTDNNLNNGGDDTTGFFFGEPCDEHYKQADLLFCRAGREVLKAGFPLIYYSWW